MEINYSYTIYPQALFKVFGVVCSLPNYSLSLPLK